MDSVKTLQLQLKGIKERIQQLDRDLKNAPKEHLVCRNNRGITRLFRVFSNKQEEYLGREKIDEIKSLAQKRYDETLLEVLKEEEDILSNAFLKLSRSKKAKALKKFPQELKSFITLNPTTNEGAVQKWNEEYKYTVSEQCKYMEPYQTLKGDIVKSKSELIIADRLFLADVPYHYEERLYLNGGATYRLPDFTIMHPYTLELYYWEHFGGMDKEDYRLETKNKIELYALNGIIQGKNFICTFEIANSPLNSWYVDKLIDQYFNSNL